MKLRANKLYSYYEARIVMLMTIGYLVVGALPRAIGMIGVKPGMEWVYVLDLTVLSVFVISVLYIAWAIYQNAKNADNEK